MQNRREFLRSLAQSAGMVVALSLGLPLPKQADARPFKKYNAKLFSLPEDLSHNPYVGDNRVMQVCCPVRPNLDSRVMRTQAKRFKKKYKIDKILGYDHDEYKVGFPHNMEKSQQTADLLLNILQL